MPENDRPDQLEHGQDAEAQELLRRQALLRDLNPTSRTSPQALEATLAAISAEVMAEAIDRVNRQTKLKKP